MPMSSEQRRRIQEQAGLTDEQLEQAVGRFSVHEESVRASALSMEQSEAVRQEVHQVGAEAALIAAKYNNIARRTARNPLREISQAEIDADRAHMESLIADEYQFINPFGKVEDKKSTIDVILNGRILFASYGGDGYQTTEGSLRIYGGDKAVLISAFKMLGHGEARRKSTGEVYEQNLDGAYRQIHTFVRRNGRWQYSASQMTTVPEEREFDFLRG